MDPFNATNISNAIPVVGNLINQVKFLINIFAAFGGIVIIFIIFTIYKFITMRKERQMLEEIKNDVEKLNKKIKIKPR